MIFESSKDTVNLKENRKLIGKILWSTKSMFLEFLLNRSMETGTSIFCKKYFPLLYKVASVVSIG